MPRSWKDALFITLNLSIVGVLITIAGLITSFILFYLFEEFDVSWKSKSEFYKVADLCIELSIIIASTFWITHYFNQIPLVFPMHGISTAELLGYITGVFYIYSVFIFLDDLTEKMRHLNTSYLTTQFDTIFPRYGSIVDLSLSYTKPSSKNKPA